MTTDLDPSLDLLAADLTMAVGRRRRRLRSEANPSELNLSQMGALARLEQEGLIERQPHPTDRRQVHFVLTEAGAAVRTRHRAAKRDWLVRALAELDPAARWPHAAAIPIIQQVGET